MSHRQATEKYSWATAPGLKGTTAPRMQFCFAAGHIWMSSYQFGCPPFYLLPAYSWNTAFNNVQAVFQTWHLKHYPPTAHSPLLLLNKCHGLRSSDTTTSTLNLPQCRAWDSGYFYFQTEVTKPKVYLKSFRRNLCSVQFSAHELVICKAWVK